MMQKMLALSPLPTSSCNFMFIPTSSSSTSFSCCFSPVSSAAPEFKLPSLESSISNIDNRKKKKMKNEGNDGNSISQIQVSREKYIPVSKSQLHDAVLSFLRSQRHSSDDDEDEDSVISHFLLLSSCLESILHAEHKSILEEMRADYFSTQSVRNEDGLDTFGHKMEGEGDSAESIEFVNGGGNGSVKGSGDGMAEEEENQLSFLNGLDLMQILGSSMGDTQNNDAMNYSTSEVAAAARFQRSFMKLLQEAQFEELSARDLMLTSALNSDYLLTLPIYVDWKKASESNAIIFRRGYCTEKQKGLLIVEKLDYLQSKVLQEIFGLVSKPLVTIGLWIKEALQQASNNESIQVLMRRIQLWVQKKPLFRQPYSSNKATSDSIPKLDRNLDRNLPIWLAAQEAVSRYEGFLSSIGPRSRLLRKFLAWVGVITPTPEVPFEVDSENDVATEPHLRPVQLSRISLNDIWRPATRKYCGNDVWRMLKVGFSIIFSRSFIQEPAFQELILLYTEQTGDTKMSSLQLKIYEKIPVPDLQVRLDIATVVGLLAYFINYRFEGVLSNPSDLLLDVIAVSALIILVIRVALGYKQTRDRYKLLVNRTLYEKTLASGFGSVHFLLDASEQQQYKECILAYGILLKEENNQYYTRMSLGEECERFMYSKFKEKVQMPVDKAVDTLINFGLVLENNVNGKNVLQVVPGSLAYDALRKRWDCLLR
ncbi:30S ribosomal protein S8 [Bienertia sinuspersici]